MPYIHWIIKDNRQVQAIPAKGIPGANPPYPDTTTSGPLGPGQVPHTPYLTPLGLLRSAHRLRLEPGQPLLPPQDMPGHPQALCLEELMPPAQRTDLSPIE